MNPRSRRAHHRGRTAALTAGVTTALVAFLPAAGAAPALHADWQPVVAGARTDDGPAADSRAGVGGSRQGAVPDPDLLAAAPSSSGDGWSEGSSYDGGSSDDGSSDLDTRAAGYTPDVDHSSSGRARPGTAGASPLASSGIPSTALEAYTRAAAAHADCGISWPLIAAIGRVESNHGRFAGATLHTDGLSSPAIVGVPLTGNGTARILDSDGGQFDGDTVHDRAVGPMQFIPTTWAIHGSDGNNDGRRDPFNIYDAAAAAARYLCAAGTDLSTVAGQRKAVFAYNHSDSYVASVLSLAATYAGTTPPSLPTAPGPAPVVPPVDPGRPPALPPVLAGPSPVATPPVVTPPVEIPPVEIPPVEIPPVEIPPVEIPPVVTLPVIPPVETLTPPPTLTPAPCGTDAEPVMAIAVDVVNGTGDQALVDVVVAALTAHGLTVGGITSPAEVTTSGIAHPEREVDDARLLAEALGAVDLLPVEMVERVTVVLGTTDSAELVEAIRAFTGVPCPVVPADPNG